MTAIEHLIQQPAAQAIGWALLQFVWQGALVGLLFAAALYALRRSAADVRYVVAAIGLSLMLTMPTVTALQTWRAMTDGAPSVSTQSVSNALPQPSEDATPPAMAPATQSTADPIVGEILPALDRPNFSDVRWVRIVLLTWLSGVALLTLRLLTGWLWVQRLRTRGTAPAPLRVAADGRPAVETPAHLAADPAFRVRDGRSADGHRVAAPGCAHAGERADRNGPRAARGDSGARARAYSPSRLPREPVADAGRDAALLPSRRLVAFSPYPDRARELLRRPRGEPVW